jgi:hypothetical protein
MSTNAIPLPRDLKNSYEIKQMGLELNQNLSTLGHDLSHSHTKERLDNNISLVFFFSYPTKHSRHTNLSYPL